MTRCRHGSRYPCGECAASERYARTGSVGSVSCWRWNCRPCKPCQLCKRTESEARAPEHIAWFQRTGHCGQCGEPGNFCKCIDAYPCGCRLMHEMGSGVGVDAADVFADAAPVAVGDDQGELFA
jgi:hypothetical protein